MPKIVDQVAVQTEALLMAGWLRGRYGRKPQPREAIDEAERALEGDTLRPRQDALALAFSIAATAVMTTLNELAHKGTELPPPDELADLISSIPHVVLRDGEVEMDDGDADDAAPNNTALN